MATLQTTSERLRQQANGSNSPSDGLRLSRSGLWAVRLGRALLWAVRLGRLGSVGPAGMLFNMPAPGPAPAPAACGLEDSRLVSFLCFDMDFGRDCSGTFLRVYTVILARAGTRVESV